MEYDRNVGREREKERVTPPPCVMLNGNVKVR